MSSKLGQVAGAELDLEVVGHDTPALDVDGALVVHLPHQPPPELDRADGGARPTEHALDHTLQAPLQRLQTHRWPTMLPVGCQRPGAGGGPPNLGANRLWARIRLGIRDGLRPDRGSLPVAGRAPTIGSVAVLLGRVAEWQTRWLQVPVRVSSWGFKSPLAHGRTPAQQGFLKARTGRLLPDFYPCARKWCSEQSVPNRAAESGLPLEAAYAVAARWLSRQA